LLRLPTTRRAYLRSAVSGVAGFFAVYIVAHQVLTRFGLRAETSYIDDLLLGTLVAVLVMALEAQHELEIRAERQRAKVLIELNHHIRNALQTIVYVNASSEPSDDTHRVAQAAQRIDWALREIPRQAQTPPKSNQRDWTNLPRSGS
jgi:cell division protein ZapA (FtsZ GTPase activity inhibitor)